MADGAPALDCCADALTGKVSTMYDSWLTRQTASRDDLLELRPALAREHRAVFDTIWAGPVPTSTLELCRIRTAMLLGAEVAMAHRSVEALGLDEAVIESIAAWPSDDRFDETDRACLALAEQYVLDVHGLTDAMVDRVTDTIGPDGVVTLTTALALWELTHRFDNALLAPAPNEPDDH